MPVSYPEILRRHARPLEPIPTDQPAVLARLDGIRAVLFDLYGTLFISAIGEVGTSRESALGTAAKSWSAAFLGALAAVGIRAIRPPDEFVTCLFDTIEASHAASREAGICYPEVDIVEVWREVLADLGQRGILEARSLDRTELERVAVEYEARANPVWPMPGLRECLESLRDRGLLLGIISNGQFYTRELFPALLGHSAEFWGFDSELQHYSFRHGLAKPGPDLYEMAARVLGRRGVEPAGVLYVGNDMLNDVRPAAMVGFRTALFAGDARSMRLRRDDPRLDGVTPDLVLTALGELDECLLI